MLTQSHIITLKRAQKQADVNDAEYREAIALISGMEDCTSSKDSRFTTVHWHALMCYLETIFWRGHTAGHLPKPGPKDVFTRPDFWSQQRPASTLPVPHARAATAADEAMLKQQQRDLENQLVSLGFPARYLMGIQRKIVPWSLAAYVEALGRTVRAKRYGRQNRQPRYRR